MADPAYAHLPEAVEAGRGEEEALDASRPSGAGGEDPAGPVRRPVRRRGPGPRGACRPGPPRGGSGCPSGRPCCCGTRVTCCRSTPRRGSDRGDRSARRFAARHDRTVGLRLRPGRDGHRAAGHPASVRGRRQGRVTPLASARPSGRSPRCSTCSAAMRPTTRPSFDDAAELQRAVDPAAAADVAVVVAGEWQNMIGEAASRSSLELPGAQLESVAGRGRHRYARRAAGHERPAVGPAVGGRNVPAILDIWYPGTQGGAAVANLIFGDVSPGGKLPFTWPRTVGQVPMIYSPHDLARAGQPGHALLGRGRAPRCSRSDSG